MSEKPVTLASISRHKMLAKRKPEREATAENLERERLERLERHKDLVAELNKKYSK